MEMERTVQQMMQQLLAKMEDVNANQDKAEVSMNASMKEQMQEMTVLMKADRKTDQARIEANKDDFLGWLMVESRPLRKTPRRFKGNVGRN
jgi:dihydroxyacetone kinase-like predicted kinase